MPVTVNTIYRDDVEVTAAKGGENLKLRLGGIEEGEIQQGFVICTKQAPVPCVTRFKAQLQVHCMHKLWQHANQTLPWGRCGGALQLACEQRRCRKGSLCEPGCVICLFQA